MRGTKLKEFADDNFKFDENGSKFSKRVENTAGKRAISPFPTVFFNRLVQQTRKEPALVWERVKISLANLNYASRVFTFRLVITRDCAEKGYTADQFSFQQQSSLKAKVTLLVVRSDGRGLGNLFTAVTNHVATSPTWKVLWRIKSPAT